MLWEHEPQASVSTAFSSSPKLSRVFVKLDRNTEYMFSISFRKRSTCFLFLLENNATRKREITVNFDYQNVNSLCSRQHYVNIVRWFCVSIELYKHDF